MESVISITVPDEIKSSLDRLASEEGVAQDEIAAQALREYVFAKQFRSLRARLRAEASRTFTDDEVFELVS